MWARFTVLRDTPIDSAIAGCVIPFSRSNTIWMRWRCWGCPFQRSAVFKRRISFLVHLTTCSSESNQIRWSVRIILRLTNAIHIRIRCFATINIRFNQLWKRYYRVVHQPRRQQRKKHLPRVKCYRDTGLGIASHCLSNVTHMQFLPLTTPQRINHWRHTTTPDQRWAGLTLMSGDDLPSGLLRRSCDDRPRRPHRLAPRASKGVRLLNEGERRTRGNDKLCHVNTPLSTAER